jgi:phosphoribosylformylglycinamidine (FGAM) synthase-like enzyme
MKMDLSKKSQQQAAEAIQRAESMHKLFLETVAHYEVSSQVMLLIINDPTTKPATGNSSFVVCYQRSNNDASVQSERQVSAEDSGGRKRSAIAVSAESTVALSSLLPFIALSDHYQLDGQVILTCNARHGQGIQASSLSSPAAILTC